MKRDFPAADETASGDFDDQRRHLIDDGVERLSLAVEEAIQGELGWTAQHSAGLRAGLDFLAANPLLAHLLLVESLAAARPARLEHERTLERLATALRPPAELAAAGPVPAEIPRLLAGGLVSHLSGRVLAGEAERLPESHDVLLRCLLTSMLPASSSIAERSAARG